MIARLPTYLLIPLVVAHLGAARALAAPDRAIERCFAEYYSELTGRAHKAQPALRRWLDDVGLSGEKVALRAAARSGMKAAFFLEPAATNRGVAFPDLPAVPSRVRGQPVANYVLKVENLNDAFVKAAAESDRVVWAEFRKGAPSRIHPVFPEELRVTSDGLLLTIQLKSAGGPLDEALRHAFPRSLLPDDKFDLFLSSYFDVALKSCYAPGAATPICLKFDRNQGLNATVLARWIADTPRAASLMSALAEFKALTEDRGGRFRAADVAYYSARSRVTGEDFGPGETTGRIETKPFWKLEEGPNQGRQSMTLDAKKDNFTVEFRGDVAHIYFFDP